MDNMPENIVDTSSISIAAAASNPVASLDVATATSKGPLTPPPSPHKNYPSTIDTNTNVTTNTTTHTSTATTSAAPNSRSLGAHPNSNSNNSDPNSKPCQHPNQRQRQPNPLIFDILHPVASYLSPQELLEFILVCREWNLIGVRYLWRTVKLSTENVGGLGQDGVGGWGELILGDVLPGN
jgi:hypothetical protein